jgi:hypothetical protein
MMGAVDVVMMLIAMSGLVGVVSILGQGYRRRLEHKERIAELRTQAASAPVQADHSELVAKLEHRIRVLERIATDKTTTLAAQIEDLREGADAR